MPALDLTKLTDTELLDYLEEAESDKANADSAIKKLKNEFLVRKSAEIKSLYSSKPEPFGVVDIIINDKKVKIDTKKKVEWDQEKLESLAKLMASDGADPKDYMKIEYKVSETLYKTWGDNIKSYFQDARTVKGESPSIKIEEIK